MKQPGAPSQGRSPAQMEAQLIRLLQAIARRGAMQLLQSALAEEVEVYLAACRHERDAGGRALVVRNGRARPRRVKLAGVPMEIAAPRIHDRRRDEHGQLRRFISRILPPYQRTSPCWSETLPGLYLVGWLRGSFGPAGLALLGQPGQNLPEESMGRLLDLWKEEARLLRQASLAQRDDRGFWVCAVEPSLPGQEGLSVLTLGGAGQERGRELIAVGEGDGTSQACWELLLQEVRSRGLPPPLPAQGNPQLGFWSAVWEVWPELHQSSPRAAPHQVPASRPQDLAQSTEAWN